MMTLSLAASLAGGAGLASAEPLQSHTQIRRIAKTFIESRLQHIKATRTIVQIGNIDPRLRLAHCSERPEAWLPTSARLVGFTTVGIRCNGNKPWSLYLQVRIRVFRRIAVARTALPRGTTIGAQDFQLVEREVTSNPTLYLSDARRLIGMRVTRPMAAGQVIMISSLAPARLVLRGQKVVILANMEGLSVRMQGTALQDGARGAIIRVRNSSSRRIIEATVVRRGTVMVNL